MLVRIVSEDDLFKKVSYIVFFKCFKFVNFSSTLRVQLIKQIESGNRLGMTSQPDSMQKPKGQFGL